MAQSSIEPFDRLADRIRQHRQAIRRPFLVLEGPHDKLTLSEVLPGADFFPASSRNIALRESVVLSGWNVDQFACVVDADFSEDDLAGLLGDRYYPYLNADLEAMIVELGGLASVITHLGSSDKISSAGGLAPVVDTICKNVEGVAALREANAKYNWGLGFDLVDLQGKFDRETLKLKNLSYCTALRATSEQAPPLTNLVSISKTSPTGSAKFHGKDVASLAGVALRSKLGTLAQAAATREHVSRALRLAGAYHISSSEWLSGLHKVLAG